MKILLITFSGTGNTTLCGNFIKKHFENRGYEVYHYLLTFPFTNIPDPEEYDIIGIGYPIHAFNTPGVVAKFVKRLQKCSGKQLFIYKTSGEPFHLNDSSSHHIYRKLKKKGYILKQEKHFLMPYNIMFRYPDSLVKQMYLYLSPLCEAFVEDILNGEDIRIKYTWPKILLSDIFRIEWVAPKANHFFFGVDKKKCNNCQMCINNCPMHALHISKSGKIKMSSKCAMCMRCCFNCPQNAITYGFMNLWKVNPGFKFKTLVDSEIPDNYVNQNTKGYFRKFRKFFFLQNEYLKNHNIEIPVHYLEEDEIKFN